MRRVVLVGLISGLLTAASGCYEAHYLLHNPFGPGSMPDCSQCSPCMDEEPLCGDGCGSCGLGPVGAPVAGPACGPVCASGCDPCGEPCDWHPLGWLVTLFHPITYCGRSCGEVYINEFHNDPPDCCDPCDRCGQYVGGACSTGGCAALPGEGPGGCATGDCGGVVRADGFQDQYVSAPAATSQALTGQPQPVQFAPARRLPRTAQGQPMVRQGY